jgi:hypothetical protein
MELRIGVKSPPRYLEELENNAEKGKLNQITYQLNLIGGTII